MITRLVAKECREHGWIMLCLIAGVLANVLLLTELGMNSEFQVSGLSMIRTSLIYLFPLITIILADRLVTREYLQRTRLFIEALPSGVNTQLAVKFCIGLLFLLALAALVTGTVSYLNRVADSITPRFFGILLARAVVFTSLLWSIAFCFSLFGRVRWFLYLILIGMLTIALSVPAVNTDSIPPFSLISGHYFAFERDAIPYRDSIGTLLIAALFLGVAAVLILRDNHTMSEKLSSPLSRFDIAAIAILLMGSLSSVAVIVERYQPTNTVSPGRHSVSYSNPSLIVSYGSPANQHTESIAATLHDYLSSLQALLGYPAFTQVVVTHDADIPVEDLTIRTQGHISLSTSLTDLAARTDPAIQSPSVSSAESVSGYFDLAALLTATGHAVITQSSSGRAIFEPYHWLLDGIVRYHAEQQLFNAQHNNHEQLLTMAAFTLTDRRQQGLNDFDLSAEWQLITDHYGYPMGIAIAYSAVDFLVQTVGEERLRQLLQRVLASDTPRHALTSIRYLAEPFETSFFESTGLRFTTFQQQWRDYLMANDRLDHALINAIASLPTSVGINTRDNGFLYAAGNVTIADTDTASSIEQCRLRYQLLSPFELDVANFETSLHETTCVQGDNALSINAFFDTSKRYYLQMDVRIAGFARPWVIHAERVTPADNGVTR